MFNQVNLMGNLTRDPEFKTLDGGTELCNFSIAVNEKYGDTEKTHFVECTAFGKLAGVITQFFSKGSPILISGKLNQETWEQEGKNRSKITVTVRDFSFVNGPKQSEPSGDAGDAPF